MINKKPHFSFWVFVGAGLLWNLMGCLNYITQSNPETVAEMPEVYQIIIDGRPAWATSAFAIGVFSGAVGCILLLLKKNVATTALLLSGVGVLVNAFFEIKVIGYMPFTILSLLVAIALIWYAMILKRLGWLD
ncbi:MAG: hypothetical protein P8M29_05460 [Tateyamaria sp.]|nr:hypothetical protein [Tateyamaria sp.]